MNLTTEIKPDHLLVTFEGTVEENFPTRFPELLFETVIAHKSSKVLVDLRKVEGTLTVMQRYTMGETGAEKFQSALSDGKIPVSRFSLVANPPLMAPDKFGEKVATNRGMPVRIFSSFQEALDWLLQEPVPS